MIGNVDSWWDVLTARRIAISSIFWTTFRGRKVSRLQFPSSFSIFETVMTLQRHILLLKSLKIIGIDIELSFSVPMMGVAPGRKIGECAMRH